MEGVSTIGARPAGKELAAVLDLLLAVHAQAGDLQTLNHESGVPRVRVQRRRLNLECRASNSSSTACKSTFPPLGGRHSFVAARRM